MSEEMLAITEKGIMLAIEILVRDGFVVDAPGSNHTSNLIALKSICGKFLEASLAKGEARSDQECQDAIVIAYFEAYLEDVTRKLN
jgi:hypothetical protein